MSLNDLKPANTKRARATAMKAFERFLSAESTSMEHIRALVFADPSRAGGILVTLMDKFGVYLAFHAGARGAASVAPLRRSVLPPSEVLASGRVPCPRRRCGSAATGHGAYARATLHQAREWWVCQESSCVHEGRPQEDDKVSVFNGKLRVGLPRCCAVVLVVVPLRPRVRLDFRSEAAALHRRWRGVLHPLDLLEDVGAPASSQTSASNSVNVTPMVGIHALVNRLLDRVAAPAGVEEPLTSHSFRRGGAQHANASSELTAQWIFDRGAWNLTTTNKAFAYVFNTPKEDHQVANVLSGMAPKQPSVLPSLEVFDSTTQEKVREVSLKLFNASHALSYKAFNVSAAAIDVLTATIIFHYPSMMKTNAQGPAMKTIESCIKASGVTTSNLLAWSQQLARSTAHAHTTAEDLTEGNLKAKAAFDHQTALIERLIEVNHRLEARVNVLEAASTSSGESVSAPYNAQDKRPRDEDESVPVKRRRRSKAIPLVDTWFAWYTAVPRGWLGTDKHKKLDAKQLVAFMKLFIEDGYSLDEASPGYKDDVRQLGEIAPSKAMAYLRSVKVPSSGSNAVLKVLRQLHRDGGLNDLVSAYRQRLSIGRVVDPAPLHHQDTLKAHP